MSFYISSYISTPTMKQYSYLSLILGTCCASSQVSSRYSHITWIIPSFSEIHLYGAICLEGEWSNRNAMEAIRCYGEGAFEEEED